ncbi:MAG: hypothetical protein IKV23_05065 [Bacteroidaceae bacterium]|nr:hypothetical protein [Bacteroidaceae bacterium]
MNRFRVILVAFSFVAMLFVALPLMAQIQSKPHWVGGKESSYNKRRSNDTYEIIKVENFGPDINVLRRERLEVLAMEISERNGHQGVPAVIEPIGEADSYGCYSEARIVFELPQRSVYQVMLIDDHEVFEDNLDMTFDFTLYQIYAVSRCNVEPVFDNFNIVKSNNTQATVLSIIPGIGQLYKEQFAKAFTIWGLEAGLISAALIFEHERSKYTDPERHSKQLGYKEFRNLSLMAAGVVYIYNLIDAAVSKGPRRLHIEKKNDTRVSIAPALFNDGSAGVAFSWSF